MKDDEPSSGDAEASPGDGLHSQSFLASHRGQAAFAREYARLTGALVAGIGIATRGDPERIPTIRQSPERCIVQLGSVALTVGWLRKNADPSAIGELLLILWRGTIASRAGEPSAFTVKPRTQTPPTILWEETLVAEAGSEADWTWRPEDSDARGVPSDVLAERAILRLSALFNNESDVPETSLSLA